MASLPPWVPASTPDNSSPTGTSGHFHMELLLQEVGAIVVRAGCRHLLSGKILGRVPQLPVHPCPSWLQVHTHFIEASYHSPKVHTWHPIGRQPSSWAKSRLSPGASSSDREWLSFTALPHPLPSRPLFPPKYTWGPGTAFAHPQGCSPGPRESKGQLGRDFQGSRNATFLRVEGGPTQEAGDESEGTE